MRAGESRALVIRGEAGVGKTALLEYVHERATGCRVARATGVQSEMELAFAGLHQLCASMLDRLDRLPEPQREALGTAFGLSSGEPPDRFFVGLAVLGLLSEVAGERPLVCLVDDAQWLDRESAQALAFVARRLYAESVALVFALRGPRGEEELVGPPELLVEGLPNDDARALLGSVIHGPLDERVRDRIIAETRGNPLALLELPRDLSAAELAGGFGLPGALGLTGRIEESFLRRLEALPPETQWLLLLAAAEPLGEPLLVWRAAERLGIGGDAATPATDAGLLEIGARVRFRHPLVRSAIYEAATVTDRRSAHGLLAEVSDVTVAPERRAWHRAQAVAAPDEAVAAELERSAGRARARGGLAAAAAFLERATELTPDPARRASRALAAAQDKRQAGAPEAALGLLATAAAGPLDDLQRARAELLRAQVAFAAGTGSDAPQLLFEAGKRLEPLDVDLARDTYLDALCAMVYLGPLDSGCDVTAVARAALAAERPGPPRPTDLLLDGVALQILEGYAAAVPALRRALCAFNSDDLTVDEGLGRGWLACYVASSLWDHEIELSLAVRHVQAARDTGALAVLPYTLMHLVGIHIRNGELATAAALLEEVDAGIEATRGEPSLHLALAMAAFQGSAVEARALIEVGNARTPFRGGGLGAIVVQLANGMVNNAHGRFDAVLSNGTAAHGGHPEPVCNPLWTLPELVEAAARCGVPGQAADALDQISERARVSGTEWALGLAARSRALLSDGEEADGHYREAIERLTGAGSDVDLGRAHLLYGEWLRREHRRLAATEQLRTAHEMFADMGVNGFAERARRGLAATGETARARIAETGARLTAQEAQIARLARDGMSNAEIGARLFISPRTVEYHLSKVFAKLDISSRNQLEGALSGAGAAQLV